MGIVIPFRMNGGFDADATKAMGDAFEAACRGIRGTRSLDRELIAKQIVHAAKTGERDPKRLCASALNALGAKIA